MKNVSDTGWILKKPLLIKNVYFTKVIASIHSSMGTVFFRRAFGAMSSLYGMYLTTHFLFKMYCYIKGAFSVIYLSGIKKIWKKIDSRKFEGYYIYSRKKVFHRTSCSKFCLESTLLNAQKHLQPTRSSMVNVLIWQFHNSNCRRGIVEICSYKGDFPNSYQRTSLSEYLAEH